MTIWIFLLLMDMIIPLSMIFFGIFFYKKSPKNINSIFGYRTTLSMKNKDTWQFAHQYCGKLWIIIGSICIIPTTIAMILCYGKEIKLIGYFAGGILILQSLILIATIIPVECALKKNFDDNGNKKE